MKSKAKTEFGDFQTPPGLALTCCATIAKGHAGPASIIEPTCGLGAFVDAAIKSFPTAKSIHGLDINAQYLQSARNRLGLPTHRPGVHFEQVDFFVFDWESFFMRLPEPILIIGNPPWVTASELSAIDSANLPIKSNFQGLKGLDARTGKSNFDIAEWMILRLLEFLRSRRATLAMLVKVSVARKVLTHIWKNEYPAHDLEIHLIDAKRHFNVAVEACLFQCELGAGRGERNCRVSNLENSSGMIETAIGFDRGRLTANQPALEKWRHLQQVGKVCEPFRWRSGIKHDCSKVVELQRVGSVLLNGLGEIVDIEDSNLYPMLKGSEVAKASRQVPSRFMLVPQRETGEQTDKLRRSAPATWKYLRDHAALFEARGSSIYRGRPEFSVFGIGSYSFAPWKVAICSLYKHLRFAVVGPFQSKPTVLDDTCYHLSFDDEAEAQLVANVLNHPIAKEFFSAFIFWDSKRAITTELLHHLDIFALAEEIGSGSDMLNLKTDRMSIPKHRIVASSSPVQSVSSQLF